MSPKLFTAAELRARYPKLAGFIISAVRSRSVMPTDRTPTGAMLFDEELVLVAASTRAVEADICSRGGATKADGRLRSRQYAESAKRLGL
ncbi:MAG: hypothetical protein H7343_20310 [Undibacterium sp.]|nr:hypothetical protein [Opitutaceae bacterium]